MCNVGLKAEVIGIGHIVWKIKFQRLPKVETFWKACATQNFMDKYITC